jgi:clan AA aspartic protease
MGLIYANITLVNGEDLADFRRKQIGEDEVRQITIKALVDKGAYTLCINEMIHEQLGLPVIERQTARFANGSVRKLDVVGPIEVRFHNRRANVDALVLPGEQECLLGAIPLESMDVIIHPLREELIVNPEHPYMAVVTVK